MKNSRAETAYQKHGVTQKEEDHERRKRPRTVLIHASAFLSLAALTFMQPYKGIIVIASVLIHELAHWSVLTWVRETPHTVIIHAFGVKMDTAARGMFPPQQMIPIAASGPLANLVFGIVAWQCGWKEWIAPNIVLACINFLPVFPLDGGQIVYAVLAMGWGRRRAKQVLRILGIVVGCGMIPIGIGIWMITKWNVTFLLMAIFIVYAAVGGGINAVMEANVMRIGKMKHGSCYLIAAQTKAIEAAGTLPITALGAVVDENGAVEGFVTARGLYHKMEQYGGAISVKECLR